MTAKMKLKDAKEIIDAHFSGRGGPHSALAAANAIAEVPEAKKYWDRQALFSSLDPQAASAKERVAMSLGVPATPKKRGFVWGGVGAFAMAAGLFAFVLISPNTDDDGFTARGPETGVISSAVFAFNISKEKEALERKSSIHSSDELAFAYMNPQGQKHLLVYGVDDKMNIYWFHPAWTNYNKPPAAIAVESSTQIRELQEAIGHEYIGRQLKLYSWFQEAPISVVEAEKAIAKAGANGVPAASLISSVTIQRKP
ncbi:MAG: hypothetical protein GY822_03065 [Deltaproteobacteria bacterium]|nr:hypothetical protein [Deltaproteobacteria bacterium]